MCATASCSHRSENNIIRGEKPVYQLSDSPLCQLPRKVPFGVAGDPCHAQCWSQACMQLWVVCCSFPVHSTHRVQFSVSGCTAEYVSAPKTSIKLAGLVPSCTFCKQFETAGFHYVSWLLQKEGESQLASEESCCVSDPAPPVSEAGRCTLCFACMFSSLSSAALVVWEGEPWGRENFSFSFLTKPEKPQNPQKYQVSVLCKKPHKDPPSICI